MNKLKLQIEGEKLQGELNLNKLNLLLIFQLNCPGCFTHALPILSKLHKNHNYMDISFLALSTAFEDFDKNNFTNSRLLLDEEILVGETKKILNQFGFDKLPYPIDFPIFMDKKVKTKSELTELVEIICHSNPNFKIWPEFDREQLRFNIHSYLESLDSVHYTFNANSFKGTPTFVLFNDKYEIREKWFGHKSIEEIENLLKNHL